MECAPTVRGEIRKARASNYHLYSALNEFADNSLDAGARTILIDFREKRIEGGLHKILISDDAERGIEKKQLREIFSWTYERGRRPDEIGEFGTGFKCAAVNLGDKLTVMTLDGRGECMQAIADWHEMAEANVWAPRILPIDEEYFRSYHPFSTGTTLMLEAIRHEFIQQQKGNDHFLLRALEELSVAYKHLLRTRPEIAILVKGVFSGDKIEHREISFSSPNEFMFYHFENAPLILESRIQIYKDVAGYRVYLCRSGVAYAETVEFVEKRKNGNNVLRAIQSPLERSLVLVDTLSFRSCTYYREDREQELPLSRGSVDIIRNHRILAREITYRPPRTDPAVAFVKHELRYANKWLNSLLGIQFNKCSGSIPEGDMRYTLEHIQKLHEKELVRFEKQKLGRILRVLDKEDDFLCLDPDPDPPSIPPSPPSPMPILAPSSPPSLMPILAPSSTTQVAMATIAMGAERRRNFSMDTKLEVIKKQECRDADFDFRLLDDILPLDYDHKNGLASNNSTENCQALSVISHALKTRRPDVLERHRRDPARYIVDLLNCITSSKHFIEAFAQGEIRVRSLPELHARDGLFSMNP